MKIHHQLRWFISLMIATCLLAILLAALDFQYNVVLHQRNPFSDKLEKMLSEIRQGMVRRFKQAISELGDLFKCAGTEA